MWLGQRDKASFPQNATPCSILTQTFMPHSNVELGSLVCTLCHLGHVIYLVFLNFCFGRENTSVMSNQLIFQLLQAALICLMFLWDIIIIIIIFNTLVMVPKVSVIFSGLIELNIPIQLGIETTHVKNGFLWGNLSCCEKLVMLWKTQQKSCKA